MSDQNLWGDIPRMEKVESPIAILKKQALYLGKMTNNLLEAEVKIHSNSPNQVRADLVIVAPTLGGYQVQIIRIQHGLEIYPVNIMNIRENKGFSAADETSFLSLIKECLQSEKVQNVIKALLIQVDQSDVV